MSLMLVAWVKVCHWVLMPITHMVLPTRLSLGVGALLRTGDPLGQQAMPRWGLSIHAIGYMSVSRVCTQPPNLLSSPELPHSPNSSVMTEQAPLLLPARQPLV